MPVPDSQSLMLPALMALGDGSATPIAEVRYRVAASERLTPEDVREMLPSGRQPVEGFGSLGQRGTDLA